MHNIYTNVYKLPSIQKVNTEAVYIYIIAYICISMSQSAVLFFYQFFSWTLSWLQIHFNSDILILQHFKNKKLYRKTRLLTQESSDFTNCYSTFIHYLCSKLWTNPSTHLQLWSIIVYLNFKNQFHSEHPQHKSEPTWSWYSFSNKYEVLVLCHLSMISFSKWLCRYSKLQEAKN